MATIRHTRQESREDLEQRANAYQRDYWLLNEAYSDTRAGTSAEAGETWHEKESGGASSLEVFGTQRPHGGYLIQRFTWEGQRPQYNVHYWEAFQLGAGRYNLETRIAIEHLRQKLARA